MLQSMASTDTYVRDEVQEVFLLLVRTFSLGVSAIVNGKQARPFDNSRRLEPVAMANRIHPGWQE